MRWIRIPWLENLEGQRDTVVTARGFSEDKAICISPVTLKPRFNPDAKAEEKGAVPGVKLPSRFDPRQASLFCAGWTLGSFKYLAESGVRSITYFETSGRGGIIHGFNEALSPEVFMAASGDLYPVYFLFRELLKFREHQIGSQKVPIPCVSVLFGWSGRMTGSWHWQIIRKTGSGSHFPRE